MTTHGKRLDDAFLAGRVAVITGAGSGIGLAMAERAASAGMKVALADIEDAALARAESRVGAAGAQVIAVRTDVSDPASVDELARRVQQELGDPWLVANNAGVAKIGLSWQLRTSDWRWVLDVNLFGVVHGTVAFLPGLVARNEGHLVNTASAAGLLGVPGGAPYVASKHAVVGLSEAICRELRATGSAVGVSVLCPAAVDTRIAYAERNRPGMPHYEAPTEGLPPILVEEPLHVLAPHDVAAAVFAAIREKRFWILPHAEQLRGPVLARARQMIDGIDPDDESMDRASAIIHGFVAGVRFLGRDPGSRPAAAETA
ncbi:MAG: SDR family NAD(P)-dependent oxidoreductase [Deltaproteobacteria bacterium]|nr:SDR family NAD(P)-dependent oxidoreductase [Deltaproteobacteria bacterium]